MPEEPFFLSKKEAEYGLMISRLAERAGPGTDAGSKAAALSLRLAAEVQKPEKLPVSLSLEEKNTLSLAITVYELLRREKYDVLADRIRIENISTSNMEVRTAVSAIGNFAQTEELDTSALQKKLRHRQKTPVRKLYISDLHFYHDSLNSHMDRRGFSGYEEMNAYMVRQWNAHVTRKDEVYILGDFAISRGRAANEILQQLKGKKYLIQGNHDKYLDDREFDRSLFEWIRPYAEIQDAKRKVILSHYPIFCYNGQYRTAPDSNPLTYMLYGHVHNTYDERLVNEFIRITRETRVTTKYQPEGHPIPCNMINCFCMFSDYIPLTLDDWIRLDADRRRESAVTNAESRV